MDLSEMRTAVFTGLDEDPASPVYWAQADVDESINEGYATISEASEWNEANAPFTFDGSNLYNPLFGASPTFASDRFLRILGVKLTDQDRWLRQTTAVNLDNRGPSNWENVKGDPWEWILRGLWHLGMYPRPDATQGLTVFHSALPAPLASGTDAPGFPAEFHYGLVEFALYDLLMQDREAERALEHFAEYRAFEAGLKAYAGQRGAGMDRGVLGSGAAR